MNKRKLLGALLVLPLVAGGVGLATTQPSGNERQAQQPTKDGYICPVTGESLPCPNCCPLNKGK